MTAKPIPDGYHSVTPYLTVRNAPKVIEFLKAAFGAKLSHDAIKRPDGSIMHAQVLIGDSRIMIAEESEMARATTSSLYLYVADVDAVFRTAVKAGGSTIMEPMDMFYGDRSGGVKDPSGTAGSSPRIRRMSPSRNCRSAPRPSSSSRKAGQPERANRAALEPQPGRRIRDSQSPPPTSTVPEMRPSSLLC